jgi:hypothetical protein
MSHQNFEAKVIRTRKAHRCIWCGEDIAKGDECVVATGLFDGEFYCNRFHPECDGAALEYHLQNGYDDGFDPHSYKRGSLESGVGR